MIEAEAGFQTVLRRLIELTAEWATVSDEFDELLDARVSTFAEEGVLTHNAGLTVRLADGSVFQLTVVQDERGGR